MNRGHWIVVLPPDLCFVNRLPLESTRRCVRPGYKKVPSWATVNANCRFSAGGSFELIKKTDLHSVTSTIFDHGAEVWIYTVQD